MKKTYSCFRDEQNESETLALGLSNNREWKCKQKRRGKSLLNCNFLLKSIWRGPSSARRSNQSILKEISPEYSFIGRTDAKTETPVLWPPDAKN